VEVFALVNVGIFKTHTDKIHKCTDTIVAFTQSILSIVSTEKCVSATKSMLNPLRSIKDGDDRDIEKITKVF
jgi:hypothetical protein